MLLPWLLSCGGQAAGASGGPATRSPAENDGGSLVFTGADGAAGTLAVSLPASFDVCPGSCVTLSPAIAGGVPPYAVRWSDGATGAGPRQVCPSSSTTTYTATVTDASGHGGELGAAPRQASARTVVTVSGAGCSGALDGGASDGPASGDAPPVGSVTTACTATFASPDSWSSGTPLRYGAAAVAVDPAGNLLVTADFGSGYLGDLTVPQGAGDAVMVAKFDPECRLLWSREYGGTGATLLTTVIAADASGDVIVGGMFETSSPLPFPGLDLGSGSYASTNWQAFVTKLGPTGKTLWVYTAAPPSSAGDGEGMDDIAVDSSGNIVLAIGGLPSSGGASTEYAVVEVDPGGKQVFVLPSSAFAAADAVMQSVAVAPDNSIWSVATSSTSGEMTLAHLAADASVLATQAVTAPAMPGGAVGAAVRLGPGGDMVLSWDGDPMQPTTERWLRDYDSTGHVRWSTSFDLYGGGVTSQLVRLDANGNAWIADWLFGSQTLPTGTLNSPNGTVEVLQVGIDGTYRSANLLPPVATDAGALPPAIADMALGPGHTLLIAGWTNPPGFVVTKLQL